MPRIYVLPDRRHVDASLSESVLVACLRAGIPHTNECRGHARCSTCRVAILEGLEFCSPRTEAEEALAGGLQFEQRVRLACQTTITGDVTIRRLILDARDADLTDQTDESAVRGAVGEERQIAILFVDIRNSTAFAETVPPFDVIHVLRRFYHHVETAVSRHGGRVASYMGDGLMALFDAQDPGDAARNAVSAGLEMLASAKRDLRPYVKRHFGREFRIGVGVHCGTVVVGTVGTRGLERITAIGDAVNVAQRVEEANKRAGTEFLVSDAVFTQVQVRVRAGRAITVELPGKTGEHTLHEILGGLGAEA